jgi:hypothetical protein
MSSLRYAPDNKDHISNSGAGVSVGVRVGIKH